MNLISEIKTIQKKRASIKNILLNIHKSGESIQDIIDVVNFLNTQKKSVDLKNKLIFDVCGTGGTRKQRINLSTILAIKLSKHFAIAKHGNKSSSGRCGSMDIVEKSQYTLCHNSDEVTQEIIQNNLAFLFGPSFHPTLGLLASIRKSIPHPTIFNLVGPLLNPVNNLTAQIIGVKDVPTAKKLAKVCSKLGRNTLLVHDTAFGLDEVSIGGETKYFKVLNGNITEGSFFPEDFGLKRVSDFTEIQGGESIAENLAIFNSLIDGSAPQAHQDFLEINYRVAKEFFNECIS